MRKYQFPGGSDIFSAITEEDQQKFFSLQGRRRCENEFRAYDTTTLSSYSETLKQVQYRFNAEHDRLPQFNLTLVFREESDLPFYYRKVAGISLILKRFPDCLKI